MGNDENDRLLATIAPDNPSAAANVAIAIAKTIARLSAFPHLGSRTDVASLWLTIARPYAYLIFYTVENDTLVIRNIRHPAKQRPAKAG
jgi:plasmid stabilization system protein ParE